MDTAIQQLLDEGKILPETAEKLQQLQPGAYCLHQSWGPGKVITCDVLTDKIVIDFEQKPGHSMKLAFATRALSVIEPEHFLAQRIENREALQQLAKEDPVSLVEMVLKGFGKTVLIDELEEALKGSIIETADFKKWWEATKKKLRLDKRFTVPGNRRHPLELRDDTQDPTDMLVEQITGTNDLKLKSRLFNQLLKEEKLFKDNAEKLLPLIEEIETLAQKSTKGHLDIVLNLILGREELSQWDDGLKSEEPNPALVSLLTKHRENLDQALRALITTRQRRVLALFPEVFGEEWQSICFKILETVGPRTAGELCRLFQDQGKQELFIQRLEEKLKRHDMSPDLLTWICNERKGVAQEIFNHQLASPIISALERQHFQKEGRISSKLRDILHTDRELIPDLVKDAPISQVRHFVRRILMAPVFDDLGRRSLLARIIKIHPSIQDLVIKSNQQEESSDENSLIVSWESLEARKKELEDLIQHRIPENSKEIALARSYGDLSENHEYKAAKEMQSVLMRRKEEYERDITTARGTDFSNPDTEKVSIGTTVEMKDQSSGKTETYSILGAWDTDIEKNILSYLSEAGKALLGQTKNSKVDLPGDSDGASRSIEIISIKAYHY